MKLRFPDGSELSAHVDHAALAATVHGPVGPTCVDCHTDKTGYPHSQVQATSAGEYSKSRRSLLPATCNKCHPGASASFAAAWTGHSTPSPENAPLVYYVDVAYRIIIPVTVLSLLAFVGLEVFWRVMRARRRR